MRVLIPALLTLSACSGPVERAERAYDFATRNGDTADRCDAAQSLRRAYAAAERVEDYQHSAIRVAIHCH